ncbi:MAG: tRNA (adenosine(37)-N6)-threonylcarbamoyltransferase complex ATPase subunit type 1 TsaE [Bacteroidaceae bacterium]|nr:tRNA (adenosine(37)-N6)-threonylcarbamoyltransferase complex ATPase subunit type 1 TsaE [Bacteroidaceae bacterium]
MEIIIDSIENIDAAARRFVEAMDGRTVFAMRGSMGAGKTTFTRAVCRQLGVTDDEVTSPTFAIVNEYQSPSGPVYHFDFYRVKNLSEAVDMGCEEYFYSGHPCFIEWPDLVERLLPEDTVEVSIEERADGSRLVTF